jgi:putative FmdB family regulatory protein
MPTYEYECDACGATFERFHSMTAKPIRTCPTCGKRKVRRLIGMGAGLIFKGSGFYATDYRSESYKNAAKADSPGSEKKADAKTEVKSGGKSETTSESKSEAKSESKPAARASSQPAAATK